MKILGLFIIIIPFYAVGLNDNKNCGCNTLNNVNTGPEIRVTESHPLKQAVASDSNWINEPVIAFNGTPFVVECNYMNPIQWVVEQVYSHTNNILKISQERCFGDLKNESTYCYTTTLNIASMNKELIGKYVCQSVGDLNKYSSFQLFISDKENLEEPFYLQAGTSSQIDTHELEYKLLIPCPVSRPSASFYLQKSVGGKYHSIKAEFIPYAGFELTNKEEKSLAGEYRCVIKNRENHEDNNVKIDVVHSAFHYFPRVSTIFTKGSLTVKCSSTGTIKLEMEQRKGLKEHNVTYITKPLTIFPYTAILDYKFHEYSAKEGTIHCLQDKDQRVLKQWKYQKIDKENGITFDYENNLVVCQSVHPYRLLSMSLKSCPSLELCSLYRKFLYAKDYTNTENLKTTDCGEDCEQISTNDLINTGSYVIGCYFDKFISLQTFFIGLDRKIYTTIEQSPMEVLVLISPGSSSLSSEKISAQCKWLTYISTDSNLWLLERKNGQVEIIDKDFSENYEDHGSMISNLEYSIAGNNDDIEAIHCYIGTRNSSRWMYSSNYFSTKETHKGIKDAENIRPHLLSNLYKREDISCPAQNINVSSWESQFDYSNKIAIFTLVALCFFAVVNTILIYVIYGKEHNALYDQSDHFYKSQFEYTARNAGRDFKDK